MLRGWTNYFRHAVAKQTFSYLQEYTWRRVMGWLRRKYHRSNWKQIRRHLGGWWPQDEGTALFDTRTVPVTPVPLPRHRHLDALDTTAGDNDTRRLTYRQHLVESRMRWKSHVRFGERVGETGQQKRWTPRPDPTPQRHPPWATRRGRVLDAFHVVRLGTQAVDEVRRRVQQDTLGCRGHKHDPLYKIRGLLRHGAEHLTEKQQAKISHCLDAGDPDEEVNVAWQCYQQLRSIDTPPPPQDERPPRRCSTAFTPARSPRSPDSAAPSAHGAVRSWRTSIPQGSPTAAPKPST